jgi:hypothetical protein
MTSPINCNCNLPTSPAEFWNSLRLITIAKDALEPPKSAECSTSHPALETYEFLKREKAYLPYTEDDLEQDAQAIRNVLAKK